MHKREFRGCKNTSDDLYESIYPSLDLRQFIALEHCVHWKNNLEVSEHLL